MNKNEQENEKQESIADIVTEKRARANEIEGAAGRDSNQFQRELIRDLRAEANRIEAAWKREAKAIAMEHAVLPAVCITKKPVGNAAAMREALLNIQEYAAAMDVDDGNVLAILDACRDALSAPTRNCDLARDWLQDLYCKFKPPATVRREMPPEWVDAVMAFCKWLLASAAERKGEGDGK